MGVLFNVINYEFKLILRSQKKSSLSLGAQFALLLAKFDFELSDSSDALRTS